MLGSTGCLQRVSDCSPAACLQRQSRMHCLSMLQACRCCAYQASMKHDELSACVPAQAVHTIHEARIVHSDLKPANFLVVEGQLKLIDFGIAKAIRSRHHLHRARGPGRPLCHLCCCLCYNG